MVDIRKPVVAGQFYPDEPRTLIKQIDEFWVNTKKIEVPGRIKALIVPHAGYIFSGQTAAWGYRQLAESKIKSSHFLIIGPSHYEYFKNLSGDNHNWWQSPLGKIAQIPIKPHPQINQPSTKTGEKEHSLEVQIPFIQYLERINCNFVEPLKITCLLTGTLDSALNLNTYWQLNYVNSPLIISTDLSHYLTLAAAKIIDKRTMRAFEELDINYFLVERNTACGREGIVLGLTLAKEGNYRTKVIYYDTSATYSGDTEQVVGYMSAVIYEPF